MSLARLLAALLFALTLACTSACDGASRGDARAADVYTVRGTVLELTGHGDDTRALVAHEAIPAFKNREGQASTMPAMRMAFGLAPSLAATALAPGRPYTLTFDVVWTREPVLRITAARALPQGAALQLAP